MESTIRSIIYTLDKIEVHGRQNIDSMLGCMQALDRLLQQVVAAKAAPVDAKQNQNDQTVKEDNNGFSAETSL